MEGGCGGKVGLYLRAGVFRGEGEPSVCVGACNGECGSGCMPLALMGGGWIDTVISNTDDTVISNTAPVAMKAW